MPIRYPKKNGRMRDGEKYGLVVDLSPSHTVAVLKDLFVLSGS
jgi:hypothetical protein